MNVDAYQKLRNTFPWPTTRPAPVQDAFDWALDGGGREIVDEVFRQSSPSLMVEVGSFMGGSALRWLRMTPDLHLVCVDPFRNTNAHYIRSLIDAPWAKKYGKENLERYASLVEAYGTLSVVRNNLWDFRDRVTLIQGRLQDRQQDISGLDPDATFLDAMKEWEEFEILDQLFPKATFIGDDWNWVDETGRNPIQDYATRLALRRNGDIYAKACTFAVIEPKASIKLSPHWKVPH